jgi:hypothetical protein
MKAFLMGRDQDFCLNTHIPPNASDLTKDLGLDMLFDAMAGGANFCWTLSRRPYWRVFRGQMRFFTANRCSKTASDILS